MKLLPLVALSALLPLTACVDSQGVSDGRGGFGGNTGGNNDGGGNNNGGGGNTDPIDMAAAQTIAGYFLELNAKHASHQAAQTKSTSITRPTPKEPVTNNQQECNISGNSETDYADKFEDGYSYTYFKFINYQCHNRDLSNGDTGLANGGYYDVWESTDTENGYDEYYYTEFDDLTLDSKDENGNQLLRYHFDWKQEANLTSENLNADEIRTTETTRSIGTRWIREHNETKYMQLTDDQTIQYTSDTNVDTEVASETIIANGVYQISHPSTDECPGGEVVLETLEPVTKYDGYFTGGKAQLTIGEDIIIVEYAENGDASLTLNNGDPQEFTAGDIDCHPKYF